MHLSKVLLYPRAQEISYRKYLTNLVKELERNTRSVIAYYQKVQETIIADSAIITDGYIDDIEQLLSLIKGYDFNDLLVQDLLVRALNLKQFSTSQVIKSLGNIFKVQSPIDSPTVNNLGLNTFQNNLLRPNITELTKGWAVNNARLIKSIEAQYLDNVSRTMFEAYKNGTSVKTLKEQLIKDYNISENRAQLIARDQIAKLNSNYVEDEHKLLGIKYYVWEDSNDIAVRPSHRVMNGKICRWDDPTVYKDHYEDTVWKKRKSIGGVELHWGQDYQCRCTCRAIIPSFRAIKVA